MPALAHAFNSLRRAVLPAALLALLGALSCGGQALEAPAPAPAQQSAQLDPLLEKFRQAMPLPPEAAVANPGMPGLSALPAVKALDGLGRGASVTGPGYHSFNPTHYLDRANAGNETPEQVRLNAVDGLAFTLYTLSGFESDTYPTSLKVTQPAGTEGTEYFVGFADFSAQRWVYSGPYNASAEAQIPFSTQPQGLLDFVSPAGNCFFILVRANPNADPDPLFVSGLELGVFGGDSAPAAPLLNDTAQGATGVYLAWHDSTDARDADFAGYVVERAPQFGGDFTELNAEPFLDSYYIDQTGVPDLNYRYRVRAQDTSGNRSYSLTIPLKADSLDTLPPVPVFKLPAGPLEAPANVTFDMSDSFDPSGGVIDTYTVSFVGQPDQDSPDPSMTFVLQPGCYFGTVSVHVGAEQNSRFFSLKVYPKWQANDNLVLPALNTGFARLQELRGGLNPLTGHEVLFGMDPVADAMSVRAHDGAGNWTYIRKALLSPVARSGDVIQHQGLLAYPFVDNEGDFRMLLFDGVDSYLTEEYSPNLNLAGPAAVSTPNELLGVFADDNGGNTDIVMADALDADMVNQQVLVPNAGMVNSLDSVYNPALNCLETVYYDGASVRWQRWDLAGNVEADSDVILALPGASAVDIVLDEITAEPFVIFFDALSLRWLSSRHTGAGWSAALLVDNSNDNRGSADLLYRDGEIYCAFGIDAGPVPMRIYRFNPGGPSWDIRNEYTLAVGSGTRAVLLPGGAANELRLAQWDDADAIRLHSCLDDDSENEYLLLEPQEVQGLQLAGAHGSDGVHVIQMSANGEPNGAFSTDGGSNWNQYMGGPNFASSVAIGAQRDGEVFVSLNNGNFSGIYELLLWDPGAQTFNVQEATLFGNASNWPAVSCSRVNSNLVWAAYDVGPGVLHRFSGNSMAPFIGVPDNVSINPVWNLCVSGGEGGMLDTTYTLAGGAAPDEYVLGYFLSGVPDFQLLSQNLILGPAPADFMTSERVRGRTLDSAMYVGWSDNAVLPLSFFEATASAFGPTFLPLRYQRDLQFGGERIEELPIQLELISSEGFEFRRTVSMSEAAGPTAVNLIAGLDGSVASFQWSNYGEWEDLPMPQIDHMSAPELVVGMDGRWHLVYHDYVTDEIKVRSTI
ncbi:hypothetical protein IT575_08955 [bacterium]|nr:hypothetical protein [bacterium]